MFEGNPLARARQLVEAGALDQASRLVRSALVVEPTSASGLTLAGHTALHREAAHDAVRQFMRATLVGHDDVRVFLNLARAQERAGETTAAIDTARRTIAHFPEDHRPRGLAALLLAASGEADEAVACLRPGDEDRLDPATAFKVGRLIRALPARRELSVSLLARASREPGPVLEAALRELVAAARPDDPRRFDAARRRLVLAPTAVDAIDAIVPCLGDRRRLVRQAAWQWQSCCLRPDDHLRVARAADMTWQVKWPRHGIAANLALLRYQPDEVGLVERVAELFGLQKDREAAAAWGRRVLKPVPADVRVWSAVVSMYKHVQAFDEAADLWPSILRRFPEFQQLHYNCSLLYDEQDRLEDARRCLRRALLLSPDYARASNQLSIISHRLHRSDEALRYVRCALTANPQYANAYVNLGMLRRFAGQYGPALTALEDAERCAGTDKHIEAGARYNAGMTKIVIGELEDGFRLIESRWALNDFPSTKRNFRQAIWPGPHVARGSLLLYLEQGLGDEIMMSWYIPFVRRDVRRLVVDCDERLIGMLSRTYEGVEFVPKSPAGHPTTRDPDLDFKTPSFHVPQYYVPEAKFLIRDHWHWAGRCGTRFPARFALDPSRLERWGTWLEKRFPGRRRIAVCWRSGHRSRDRDRHYLTPAEIAQTIPPGTVVVNVQYSSTDDEIQELQQLGRRHGFEFVTPEGIDLKNDLEDVSAILQSVDATITAMTAVAWLASAVGCPTHAFLTTAERVFWPQLGTPFVPWAPSFRLYYRDPAECWGATIKDIRTTVSHLLSADR